MGSETDATSSVMVDDGGGPGAGSASGSGGDAAAGLPEDLGASVRAVDTKQHEKRVLEERLALSLQREGEQGPSSSEEAKVSEVGAVKREILAVKEILRDLGAGDVGVESEGGDAQLVDTLKERLRELRKEKKRLLAIAKGPKAKSRPKVTFNKSSLSAALEPKSKLLETERDKLIRTGVLTPFDRMKGLERKQAEAATQRDESVTRALAAARERSARSGSGDPGTAPVRLGLSEIPSEVGERGSSKFNWAEKRRRIAKANLKASKAMRGSRIGVPGGRRTERPCEADTESEEEHQGEELADDVVFDGGYRLRSERWDKLFDYQRTGVKWMWELHNQGAGGILGDEMGLGKTVQIIAFLDGLLRSGMYSTSLIVCPVTLMSHWAREFRRWAPEFRVFVLHDSAFKSNDLKECHRRGSMHYRVINAALRSSRGILITSYEQLRLRQDQLLHFRWGYAILDEGHKIRNPNIELTLVCKQLATPHRLILTGAPIQNRLVEIWSLFDFVFPGKLGTLPVFTSQFSIPIQMGGYAHASQLQVTTAYKCALILRDLISPYLLRRRKVDVNVNLPKKSEHVLFCLLGDDQLDLYRDYLCSHDCESIMDGKIDPLAGIDTMKKICNHPDLLDLGTDRAPPDGEFGAPGRSGKLTVLIKVLEKWCSEGHKVLVFSQTRQMLDIIERAVLGLGHDHLRMDGTTAIGKRQQLVDEFNETEEIKLFCLTTRVGGLGLNLTGADRVILYDPDWNPSTDLQAQERSWRIGQQNEVVVYRLVTSGTIEEKIYNRQIFKQFLTNKVLEDPKQRRAFQNEDIRELFVLGDEYKEGKAHLRGMTDLEAQLAPDEVAAAAAKEEGEAAGGAEGESTILKTLMEGDVVAKALCHEKIMTADRQKVPAYDKKATEIARRAAELMKRSQRDCALHSVSTPTWTGNSGSAGAPKAQPRRFGGSKGPSAHSGRFGGKAAVAGIGGEVLTSGELVDHIRRRDRDVEAYAKMGDEGEGDRLAGELLQDVIRFFKGNKGPRGTAEIVEHFSFLEVKATKLFKQVLKQAATLEDGLWTLKSDFT